jgi:hypothetical protein
MVCATRQEIFPAIHFNEQRGVVLFALRDEWFPLNTYFD